MMPMHMYFEVRAGHTAARRPGKSFKSALQAAMKQPSFNAFSSEWNIQFHRRRPV